MSVARQNKAVKTQQSTVRDKLPQDTTVEAVKGTIFPQRTKNRPHKHPQETRLYKGYGNLDSHSKPQCVARRALVTNSPPYHKAMKLSKEVLEL